MSYHRLLEFRKEENMQRLKCNRGITVLIAAVFCIAAFLYMAGPSTVYGETTMEKVGLVVTGKDVKGTEGFQKNIICLTETQREELKENKNPQAYGLGDCWAENRIYSSYDKHGLPNYHYSIVDGLDINSMLENTVSGGMETIQSYMVSSSGGYDKTFFLSELPKLQYFAPGDVEGQKSAGPMIAFYKTTNKTTDSNSGVVPEGPAQKLASGDEVLVFGQTEKIQNNNCHFIKNATDIIAGNLVTVLKSDSDRYVAVRLYDIINWGIYEKAYTFASNGGNVTHKVKGVPLSLLIEKMSLGRFMPEYAQTDIQLVSQDGTAKFVTPEDIDDCFVAWGFADDRSTPEKQTGEVAVYIPGTTQEDSIVYNLSKVNIVDKNGAVITEIPQKPSPSAPTAFKAAKSSYNSIKLTWKKAKGADSCQIYRYNGKTKSYALLKTLSANTTAYTDKSLATNTTYKYKIRSCVSVNGKTYYSGFSTVSSAKPTLSQGAITKLSKSGKTAVKIKWKKIAGANGYQIYRATKKTGTYKKVATVKKGSKVSYTNKKLKKGKTYYYKVRPYRTVSGKKQYGAFSKVKKIKR